MGRRTSTQRGLAFSALLACLLPALAYVVASEGYRTGQRSPSSPAARSVVARVVDGDTIVLRGGERVRLIGVDTPEMNDPRPDVRALAVAAAAFVRATAERKAVRLEYDWERRDRYGRTLAYVYLEDGTFLNAEIIRQGYGFAYTRFPFRHLEEFRKLEREAREAGRGLWRQR
jgi:micrococcal nuclease